MQPLGIVLFVATYVLISLPRLGRLGLDRPAGALLGAVLFVGLGVLRPEDAIAAIDGSTLLLLFAVMGTGAFLAVDGFFDTAEAVLLARARTPAALLAAVVWGAGLLAALVTNDAVCLLGAPFVVRIVRRVGLPPLPYLLALATAANTGSAATLVGNPQNMLCAQLGHLEYASHLRLIGPVAILGLAINHAIVWLAFRTELGAAFREPVDRVAAERTRLNARSRTTLVVVALTVVVYTLGADLAWTAAAALVLLMLLHRRDAREIWTRIDWSLLVFFAGLFVVVRGLVESGAPAWLFARFPLASLVGTEGSLVGWARAAALFLFGSNLVSNVPFILVVQGEMNGLPSPERAWEVLAMASTFAGNLTLLGSAANVIVAEAARDVGGISFIDYLKVGVPVALTTTAAGVLWVWLVTT